MNCPVCKAELQEVERSGVRIDVCGQCRGVWLDRGELERILEMAAAAPVAAPVAAPAPAPAAAAAAPVYAPAPVPAYAPRQEPHGLGGDDDHDDDDHGHRRRDEHGRELRPGQRRRGGWLEDILGGLGGD